MTKPQDRPEGLGIAGGLLLAAAIGGVLGALLLPRARAESAAAAPGVLLAGEPMPTTRDEALGRLRERLRGPFRLQLPDGSERSFEPAELGVGLDEERLDALLSDAADAASPLSRLAQRSERRAPIELGMPLSTSPAPAAAVLLELKDELDRPARDARLDLSRGSVISEQEGRRLDVDRSLSAIFAAVTAGLDHTPLVFERQAPERRAADLQKVRFDQVLGAFETRYDRSERAAARTFNLALAASKLDGHVLFPGEVLDFNAVVGPRDEASGFQVAPVIAQGELVDGIGGGTCQISGTLHAAAFFAGLTIVERHPHTRPSAYIELGLDAAVVYPTLNLRLQNPYDFPVVLHERVENGVVRAEIRGPERSHVTTLIRRIDRALPFEEVERLDPSLARGTRVIEQRGVPGLALHRYRIVRRDDHSRRERFEDVYPPTAQIVRVGTGLQPTKRDGEERTASAAPEYVAHELLVMTQAVDARLPALTSQTPGQFGRAGWSGAWRRDADRR